MAHILPRFFAYSPPNGGLAVNAFVFRAGRPLRYRKNLLFLPRFQPMGGALRTRIGGLYFAIARIAPQVPPATSHSAPAVSAAVPGSQVGAAYCSFCYAFCSRPAFPVPFRLDALAIGDMAILGAAILATPVMADAVFPGAYRLSVCAWMCGRFPAHAGRSFRLKMLLIYEVLRKRPRSALDQLHTYNIDTRTLSPGPRRGYSRAGRLDSCLLPA